MNIKLSRAFPSTLVVICAVARIPSMEAQQSPLAPAEVGQIADAVLAELLFPPGKRVSRVPVASRGVFFDHGRTMAAFRHVGTPSGPTTELKLRSAVSPGSRLLLDDCAPGGRGPCDRLGWGVYAWIEPVMITTSQARVRAHIWWPDRGPVAFEGGVAPRGRATLVGYAAELYLNRTQDGKWQFQSRGGTVAYE